MLDCSVTTYSCFEKLGVWDVSDRQSIRGGDNADKDTNNCTRFHKRRQARLACRDISTGGTDGDTLDCSEPSAILHIDGSRAYFHAKAQRPVLVRLPAEDQGKNDAGESEPLKKRMYGTCDAAGIWECD